MKTFLLVAVISGLFFIQGCDDDDDVMNDKLNLNIAGLSDLGSNHVYEGWIIVNGTPQSTGTFTVNSSGALSKTEFDIDDEDLEAASAFVLTIEPANDPDPNPTAIHVLAGDFSGNNANLSISHSMAIGRDFSTASGGFILATPTDGGMMSNEKSGVWFLNPMPTPTPALSLPALPAAWKYEGWAVINSKPLTTGKFTSVTGADESSPFSGAVAGPPFPGEDYLMNAPSGLSFPLDLSGDMIVITIEPNPDNSPEPFMLKPLSSTVPSPAADHTLYTLNNTISTDRPSGTVSR